MEWGTAQAITTQHLIVNENEPLKSKRLRLYIYIKKKKKDIPVNIQRFLLCSFFGCRIVGKVIVTVKMSKGWQRTVRKVLVCGGEIFCGNGRKKWTYNNSCFCLIRSG